MKKVLILIGVAVIVIMSALYIFRHAIIRYYAEKIIRENLPSYIRIDRINFDFALNRVSLGNFKVLNPPGYSSENLINIREIKCGYDIKGSFIPESLEIRDVSFIGADIQVERLKSGSINASGMESFTNSAATPDVAHSPQSIVDSKKTEKAPVASRKISDYIKLPKSFTIKDASIGFLDRLPYDRPHLITVESIDGEVSIVFGENYSSISSLNYVLEGVLDGNNDQTIKWTAYLDPRTPRLTMSNRFEVSGLDLLAFEPYYDSMSPFIFKKGKFSGTLVFDFDNGMIGSTNEIRISDYLFYVKPGYENAQMWETSVQDLLRYFTTASGDVVFDFKLKGDMSHPTFYLGPISKRALTSMAIDKVADYAIKTMSKQADNATGQAGNTQQAINLIKQFMNKK